MFPAAVILAVAIGFLLLPSVVMASAAQPPPKPPKPPEPPEPGPAKPPEPAVKPPLAGAGGVYRTPLSEVDVDESGWIRLPGRRVEVTAVPLVRLDLGTEPWFARLTYADALAYAKKIGARLPTTDELDAVHSIPEAVIIPPCTGAPGTEGTRKAANEHDRCVQAHLNKIPWNGRAPVINAGKHWVQADPGRKTAAGEPSAANYGWWKGKKGDLRNLWQGKGHVHNWAHVDESQTTILARDV